MPGLFREIHCISAARENGDYDRASELKQTRRYTGADRLISSLTQSSSTPCMVFKSTGNLSLYKTHKTTRTTNLQTEPVREVCFSRYAFLRNHFPIIKIFSTSDFFFFF